MAALQARTATTTPARTKAAAAAAKPVEPPRSAKAAAKQAEPSEAVQACREAMAVCATLVKLFTFVSVEDLLKKTRGTQEQSFPRQVLMAGLVIQFGFNPTQVGEAIGRDPSTVEHACRVIRALLGDCEAVDLIDALGEDGVREYLGGRDLVCQYDNKGKVIAVTRGAEQVEEFIDHAEQLVEGLFASFVVYAIQGPAYRAGVERLKAERLAREGVE